MKLGFRLTRAYTMLMNEYENRTSESERDCGCDFGEGLDLLESVIAELCDMQLERSTNE